MSRLQPGESDQDWVSTSFGNPVSKLTYADGTEIWKYRNRSEKDTEVGLFLVFSVDIDEERTETLSIEFTDGLVTNYWIEEDWFQNCHRGSLARLFVVGLLQLSQPSFEARPV